MQYHFDDFVLDTDRFDLTKDGTSISLEPKTFDVLVMLVENKGRVVSKDELFDKLWPGVFVSDASISSAVKQVRQALGDDGQAQRFVRTIRGKGFSFVADIRTPAAAIDAPVADRQLQQTTLTRPTIAIRPFQLVGAGVELSAIAEAIPAELIATLSKLRWIRVIARASSFQFADPTSDLRQMASQLGSHYAVSGLVEIMGPQLSVFAELSDTSSGEVVWTNRYAGKTEAIFEIRTQIALDLSSALELRLPLHEAAKLEHTPSEHLDAWDHYHLGVRHMYRYNKRDNAIAAAHFSKALALDPSFARALSGLSYTEFQNAFQHFGSDGAFHRKMALDHAERAVSLDPLDPFCNLHYGRANWLAGDPESALTWVDNAITANPNYAFGYFNRATLYNALCNGMEAEANAVLSLELSPLDPHLQSMFGTRAFAAFLIDDVPTATHFAKRAMNAPNPHLYVYTIAALAFDASGDAETARHCINTIKSKDVSFGRTDFLKHYALRGDPIKRAETDKALSRLGL